MNETIGAPGLGLSTAPYPSRNPGSGGNDRNVKYKNFVVDSGRWEAVYVDAKGKPFTAPVVGFATREIDGEPDELMAMTFDSWTPEGNSADERGLCAVDELPDGEFLCVQASGTLELSEMSPIERKIRKR